MTAVVVILVVVLGAGALAYFRAPLLVWTAAAAAALVTAYVYAAPSRPVALAVALPLAALALVLNFPPLRRRLLTAPVFRLFRRILPSMSDTEREALEAGTVWWEGELFNGAPRWRRLVEVPAPRLAPHEQAFLDGPVEELCRRIDDWDIAHVRKDLPPEIWAFLKEHGFFGLIIPKRYGGLEFSAQAHSAVVMKVASRSVTAAVTVMVPNSLGPAELLLHYGTEEQKDHYLPRLARGEEVPCFALTSPEAGSDASNMPDRAFVCRGEFGGRKDVLGMRVTWDKRYITLGPVATVLGLAFRLFDPDHLLGPEEETATAPSVARGPRRDPSGDIGITLALIPTDTPGVEIGARHNPLDIPFQNGPTRGREVFIPLDWVIGGRTRVGHGWRMLMDCLAAGRSISLPALSTGAGKLASRATGAYARIRKQFKVPIGRFEAIEEGLARIAGYAYLMDAARSLTARAVDLGEKPAVASAIVKYQLTEHMRKVVNDAMDIQGGGGICLGPRNFMGRVYQALPISITVEGANILTRALIVYGQGAIRCHPYVLAEMQAVINPDPARGLRDFDRALFGHVGFTLSNGVRAFWLGLTDGRLVRVPFRGPVRRHAQRVTRLSAGFAFISDMAMLTLGGTLKRKEKISGRFADALSFLYFASAAIKRFEDDGRPAEDRPLLDWACTYCLHEAEKALVVILKNFPSRFFEWLLGGLVFPSGRHYHVPSDAMGQACARLLLEPSAVRERLTRGIFVTTDPNDVLGKLEDALPRVIAAEALERKLAAFAADRPLLHGDHAAQVEAALGAGVVSAVEAELLRAAYAARAKVVAVDEFATL
jgi:acyl-CoA dehydrogenase